MKKSLKYDTEPRDWKSFGDPLIHPSLLKIKPIQTNYINPSNKNVLGKLILCVVL